MGLFRRKAVVHFNRNEIINLVFTLITVLACISNATAGGFLYVDDDLRLLKGSPFIDAGFNNAVVLNNADLDNDYDFSECLPVDYYNNPRFADDPSFEENGCGVPVIVDIGAFEFAGEGSMPFRGDLNGDLIVNTADLLVLFGNWGLCSGCCLADFEINGSVDTVDLLILFGEWN